MSDSKTKLPLYGPVAYAAASVALIPLIAATLLMSSVVLFISWPILPFMLYFHRRDEIKEL